MKDDIKKAQGELKKTKAELWLLHEISNAMRTTLNLPEVLYIILSAVTSQEGLGFNRAMLFLVNKDRTMLEGEMAIGPTTAKEAFQTWKKIEDENLSFDKIVDMFHRIESHVTKSPLNNIVKETRLPLNENSGILTMCVLEGMNFEATTEASRKKIKDPTLKRLKSEHFVCVPLKGKHEVLGALLVDNKITKKAITKDDTRVLTMFADQAGLAIENAHLYEETKFQAHTDSLTRLWNHGYFQNALSGLIKNGQEQKSQIILAMIDLDNFKAYNDVLGHQKGDVALREIASVFRKSMRGEDLVCRYGGEEFAIIMPGINKKIAFKIIERLRAAVEKKFQKIKKDNSLKPLTVSTGIASFPNDAQEKHDLIKKADEALYKAKDQGKNKTVVYTQEL
ncbi:MAG: sensor domain-containing diguanylate cyclase [Candidatus Omnitrophica bacterium]|nr:sensor domain-containing diguanylate cyclase [Candidatus Omnitrophota bacterium]